MTEPRKRLRRGERQERISKGLCPECASEAAPFLLCWSCRLKPRLNRVMARGVKIGALNMTVDQRFSLNKHAPAEANKEWNKWSTLLHLDEKDGRGKPRLHGIRVDVEGTLVEVMKHIGRPCTTEEILSAWGRLRSKRTNPLAGDLGRLIVADEKRARKLAKRAAPAAGVLANAS